MARSRRARGRFGRVLSCSTIQGGLIALPQTMTRREECSYMAGIGLEACRCSHVLSAAFQDRKIIVGTLQRIDGQAGCNASNSVAQHGRHHHCLCALPFSLSFPRS